MNELNNLYEDVTITIVANKLNTLKYCEVVYKTWDRKLLKYKIWNLFINDYLRLKHSAR